MASDAVPFPFSLSVAPTAHGSAIESSLAGGGTPARASTPTSPLASGDARSPTDPSRSTNPSSASPLTLIAQGAESRLYRTTFLCSYPPTAPTPTTHSSTTEATTAATTPRYPLAALKHRPPKPYRHPTLDARLTRTRLLAEARALVRCRRAGCRVPGVLATDPDAGVLVLEWVAGWSVKEVLGWALARDAGEGPPGGEGEGLGGHEREEGLRDLMRKIGIAVGALHQIGVVHGDLTTSNLMLRPPSPPPVEDATPPSSLEGEVWVIDFGLATQSLLDEDKAVDLYVLERAFSSTHPGTEDLFQNSVLASYRSSSRAAKGVLRRLEDVRMRGRKKSMIG